MDAAFVVTDSPAQLGSYDPPAIAADVKAVGLGALVVGPRTGRRVYLSVALAGTEPLLLAALLDVGLA